MSRAALSPQVTVGEPGRRQVAVSLDNCPFPLSRRPESEVGARIGAGPPTLQQALRLTFQLAAQITVETGPQVKARVALQQACQVPSAEVLPVALQFNVQVPVEFGSPIVT